MFMFQSVLWNFTFFAFNDFQGVQLTDNAADFIFNRYVIDMRILK